MVGPQSIIPQAQRLGRVQGIAIPVTVGVSSVLLRAVLTGINLTTPGLVVQIDLIASRDNGVTWRPVAGTSWESGADQTESPGLSAGLWDGVTHVSGVLTLPGGGNVGLDLTCLDATGGEV